MKQNNPITYSSARYEGGISKGEKSSVAMKSPVNKEAFPFQDI